MTSKLGPVANAGGDLFIINLQDGRSIKSSDLKAGNVKMCIRDRLHDAEA